MTSGARPFAELVAIGRVVKPQGRRGEVAVEPLSDRPGRFEGLRQVYLAEPPGAAQAVAVTGCWPHKGRYVLKLAGCDSIDAAETLRGRLLAIGEEELERLPEGSFYHHQLVGLLAVDGQGRELGRVSDVWDTGGGAPLLVLRGAAGETLLPLAEEFVSAVDPAAGRLSARLPESVAESPSAAAGGRRAVR